MRVKFKEGKQREFIDLVLEKISAPSLHELINRGVSVNYQTLKNYYSGRRLLPLDLFKILCKFSGFKEGRFDFEIVEDNWGQAKGGKISRKK